MKHLSLRNQHPCCLYCREFLWINSSLVLWVNVLWCLEPTTCIHGELLVSPQSELVQMFQDSNFMHSFPELKTKTKTTTMEVLSSNPGKQNGAAKEKPRNKYE